MKDFIWLLKRLGKAKFKLTYAVYEAKEVGKGNKYVQAFKKKVFFSWYEYMYIKKNITKFIVGLQNHDYSHIQASFHFLTVIEAELTFWYALSLS